MSNEALRLADSIHEMNNAAYVTAIANLNEKNRQQAERIVELETERDQLRAEVERLRPVSGWVQPSATGTTHWCGPASEPACWPPSRPSDDAG